MSELPPGRRPAALLVSWALGIRADRATAATIRHIAALIVLAELLAAGRAVDPGPRRLGRPRPGARVQHVRDVRLARGSQSGRRPRG